MARDRVRRRSEGEASILHADLDSFFASVEQRDDPRLLGKPVAVGGGGVILAASYEAKAFGVKTAMNGREARERCPRLVFVPPRFAAYTQASRDTFEVFHDTTPLVEGISIDEAFLDVGGLRRLSGTPVEIAERLRQRVRAEVGLPITVGVACTKFLAKVASAVGKPDGLLLVPPGGELDFLHPLPVERLWGVGPKTSAKLHGRGFHTVGELAAVGEEALVSMLGPGSGRHLHALAHNHDPREVVVGRRRRSIGSQSALGSRGRTWDELDATLVALVDRVSGRLRKASRVGRTVVLRIRLGDFRKLTRSRTLPESTAHTATILDAVRALLAENRGQVIDHGVTLLGVTVANLDDADAVQLALPFHKVDATSFDEALDEIRARFGKESLRRAVHIGGRRLTEMPILPD
jgi:DNA polymerase-4